MRTTLDLPDAVFRELKSRAALEGLTLKDLIARFVANGLRDLAAGAGQVAEPAAAGPPRFVSAFDMMQDGCGVVRSGAGDLATNPRHLEGFGRE